MSTRKVTLYATKGGTKKVDTDATTWGELKPLVEEHYDLSNLQPTESVNKTTLLHNDAALPEGPFVLFLRPVKTKSGLEGTEGKGFRELRAMVANDAIKEHLSNQIPGKNWTQLGTEDLRAGLASYEAGEPVEQAVEEVEVEAEEVTADENVVVEITPLDKAKQVKKLLEEICEESDNDDICDRVEFITDEVDGVISDLEEEFNPEAVAARRAEEEEQERLDQEFKDLESGF